MEIFNIIGVLEKEVLPGDTISVKLFTYLLGYKSLDHYDVNLNEEKIYPLCLTEAILLTSNRLNER